MTVHDQSDIFTIYTVTWQVREGRRWKKQALAAMKDKNIAGEMAEKIRTSPRSGARNVQVVEERVREVRTSVLPYWVPAGDAA